MTKFYLYLSRYLAVLLLLVSSAAWSQSRTVTGKVTSSDDRSGIPGANIVEKGTSNGTISAADGSYSLSVPENAILVFSFVGYKATEAAVGSQTTLDIVLETDVTALSEVVVIGYGEIERKDATGSIASVKSSDFNRGVISSPEQLIQGKTAGVQITTSSGEPGAGVNIRIRGTSSVRGGNNPLYVIDGVPLVDGDVSAGGADFGRGTSSPRNPLNFLNPSDIASIDILKDASATAIYGSRGANGVVLITTKSGKGTKNVFEYSGTVSIGEQAKYYDLLNREEYLAAIDNLGGDAAAADFGSDTDWQKEISRTSVSYKNNLSYANSFASGNIRASLSSDRQEGVIKNSALDRLTGRLNFNKSFLKDKLKFAAQLTLSNVKDVNPPITTQAGFEGDLLGAAYMTNPTRRATTEQYQGDIENPLALLAYSKDNTSTNRGLYNLSLGYDITPELNFKVNTGFDRVNSLRSSAFSGFLQNINNVNGFGRAYLNSQKTSSDLLETFISYKKDLGNSNLSAVLGYSYQIFNYTGLNTQGWGFSSFDTNQMIEDLSRSGNRLASYLSSNDQQYAYTKANNTLRYQTLFPAPTTTVLTGIKEQEVQTVTASQYENYDELQSFFARVNYSLNDKYLLTASMRADGSTRFGGDNRYGYFPSAAAAWRLSEETFTPEFFDELKLRIGYGVTGNQSIPHNLWQARQRYSGYGINNDGTLNPVTPGLADQAYAYPNLKWEQTAQLNIGFDFGIFGSRLTGTVDYYNKNTTNLLMQIPTAQPAPTPFNWRNLDANVINSGVELTLNGTLIAKEKFNLTLNYNIAFNKNEVKNSGVQINTGVINGQGLSGAYAQRIADGQPLYAFFLRDFAGFDENGVSIYNGGDVQKFLGKSPIPKINSGFNLALRYANWNLSAYMYGQFGHYVYNNAANAYFTIGAINNGRNVTKEVLTSGETNSNAPDVSTRFLEKGDFIRLQNLNLSYTVPMTGKIKNLTLSATGQNLFVITKYNGLDPEVNIDKSIGGVPSLGIDYTSYPRSKVYSFGLNLTF